MMTFSYAEGLVIQGGSIHGTGLAFLHTDLDIKGPVYVGDTITVVVEVTEQRAASSGNRGVVTTRNTVYNQHGDVVMVYSPVRLTKGAEPVADVIELTDVDQVALRQFFRHHFQERVAFNKACGVRITTWHGDEATFELGLRDDLTAHPACSTAAWCRP